MSGPEPPPSEARLHGWLFIESIAFKGILCLSQNSRLSGPPQAPTLMLSGKVPLKPL